jgi:hypothetical protein
MIKKEKSINTINSEKGKQEPTNKWNKWMQNGLNKPGYICIVMKSSGPKCRLWGTFEDDFLRKVALRILILPPYMCVQDEV